MSKIYAKGCFIFSEKRSSTERMRTNVKSNTINSRAQIKTPTLTRILIARCGRKTRATKKYSIRSAPNILVIHLKRFDSTHAGKLSHYVSYPEILSLNELTGTVQYRLYGVLVHLGYTSHSGHYYAYVRGPNGHQWYKADDTSVNGVSAADALSQNAYILFYTRISETTTTTTTANPAPSQSIPIPRSILVNGLKGPSVTTNGTNHIPSNSSCNNGAVKNGSTTSSYLNGICVGKRPSSSPVFTPRVIYLFLFYF